MHDDTRSDRPSSEDCQLQAALGADYAYVFAALSKLGQISQVFDGAGYSRNAGS